MTELPWIKTARELIAQREIPGSRSNPIIIDWAQKIGGWVKKFYTNDDIPWCGLFVGHCINANGLPVPPDMLLATAWNKYGKKLEKPAYGCIAVWRWASGHYHVSFIIGKDKNGNYLALGGNQSNQVKISTYPKGALVGARFPEGDYKPENLPVI